MSSIDLKRWAWDDLMLGPWCFFCGTRHKGDCATQETDPE